MFLTMRDYFLKHDVINQPVAVLRHDVDAKPQRNSIFYEVEKDLGVVSSNFLLVHDINYNPFSVNILKLFKEMEEYGCEIGLHTNYVETAKILGMEIETILEMEINALRTHFNVYGIACHRNIDHIANSLPHLENNWSQIKRKHDLTYQAYGKDLIDNLQFVNEGLNPHLGWRGQRPEEAIANRQSFCLSTHPHWWHREHPFED